jgi:hypothetical protein
LEKRREGSVGKDDVPELGTVATDVPNGPCALLTDIGTRVKEEVG